MKKLFNEFGYQYNFKWEDISGIFNVKKSRSSKIINLMLESDLIEQSEPTLYRFKK